jgi:predicted alpha/beta superfamily hydrolase
MSGNGHVQSLSAHRPGPARNSGELRYHLQFPSIHLGNERTLVVHLPPGYGAEPEHRYPVFYLHDGQNLFDASTSASGIAWRAAETADRLIHDRKISPVILVGIDNTPDRINEYTLHHDARVKAGGKGRLYGRFVVEEVKPFIDRTYRTLPDREHTAVGGSSLGGLISLAMAREHHGHLSMCAILSPALWWARGRLLSSLTRSSSSMPGQRFWLDMGTREGPRRGALPPGIAQARRLVRIFESAGLRPGRDFQYSEVPDGEHNEAAWAARFDQVLLFFFGTKA